MNSIDQYRDSSLDGLVEFRASSSRKPTGSRHSRQSSAAHNLIGTEEPTGPTIAYPGSDTSAQPGVQRSFSQRARGRPYADEAYLEDELASSASRPSAGKSIPTEPTSSQTSHATAPSAAREKEDLTHRQRMIQENIKSAAGSVRSPRDRPDTNVPGPSAPIHDTLGHDAGLNQDSAHHDSNLPADERDWAQDRSPLQKLEVTLNDISKEEKRARVQEAEMLHREKTRSQRTGDRGSSRRSQQATSSQPSTIQDVGVVRNLSNNQRDRLQHSTAIDTHKPDTTRLSSARPSGQAFDYSPASVPTRSVTITRRSNLIDLPGDTGFRRSTSATYAQPADVLSRASRQDRSVSATTQPSARDDPSMLGAQRSRRRPSGDRENAPTAQERNASHQAALDQLTGSPAAVKSKSGSRRGQTTYNDPPPLLSQANDPALGKDRGIDGPSPPVATSVPVTGSDRQQPSSYPYKEPIGTDGQTVPGSKRRSSVSFKEPYDRRRPIDEWKAAEVARLAAPDFLLEAQDDPSQNKAWWEQDAKSRRRSSRAKATAPTANIAVDDRVAEFQPRLYLKAGPLLRYTGMKRTVGEGAKEYWRGSVMMVTQDSQSSYDTPPVLRLFSQPKSLLARPKPVVEGEELADDQVDPIAGTIKMSRIGRALYVRPVENLAENQDLSLVETDDGLFQSSPPMTSADQNGVTVPPLPSRTSESNGERFGRYKEVKGVRLYADPDRDVTFWLFLLEVQLGSEQQHIGYRINGGAASGFWVPAEGQTMNIMFHSCNGFSMSFKTDDFCGPDPMWRDVLNSHQSRPFHVMIGGGDQIYSDKVMNRTQHFKDWTASKNSHYKHHAPFTHEMKEELENFYLDNYMTWFSQGLFGVAGAQIPMVNMWDDHDIIDGFGSYPHAFQLSPVFSGIGNIAYKYYMLFQQHSVDAMTQVDEPSWLLGYKPGPYIKQLSRSIFLNLGRSVAFLALDCRTERMRNQVLSVDTCDVALERCRKEIVEGETKHLFVLLGVPIAYPRMNWLENVLSSRAMDPVKAMGRAGVLKGGFLNRFDGGVEVLDDIDDHWTANHHKEERNEFIKELQDLAAERSVRITILGGDVHLCAIGQFYSNPKLKIPKDRDHRYMPNVISSAIVNGPPPEMLADVLNKRNKVHHLDQYTDEAMIPMFTHDTNMKKRNNKHLLPRRNWCSITEYTPGRTPPSSRSSSPSRSEFSEVEETEITNTAQPRRKFSLSRDDVNPRMLFRRISSRKAPPTAYRDGGEFGDDPRAASFDGVRSEHSEPRSWTGKFGRRTASETRESTNNDASLEDTAYDARRPPPLRPGFHRRPTNLSEKAAKKGNVPAVDAEGNEFDVNDHVNLDGGLDIVLNCEVDQHDPSGITEPYRLLVPALWYDGSSDREKLDEAQGQGVQRKPTLLNKMGFGGRKGQKSGHGLGDEGDLSGSDDYSSGSEEVVTETTNRPEKKKFGFFGSLRKKRPEDDFDHEYDDQDYNLPVNDRDARGAPLSNKEAALNSNSVHDQVTSQRPGSSHAAQTPQDTPYDRGQQGQFSSPGSFNRPPGQHREAYDAPPKRSSSFKATNLLRKNSRNKGTPTQRSMAAPVDTNQRYSEDIETNEPSTPVRQNSYTIGPDRARGSQNAAARAGRAAPFDADSAYMTSHGPARSHDQIDASRMTSNTGPPSSYPRQEPIPGHPTDNDALVNPKQRSLRGSGLLGRFRSQRSTSADQVPRLADDTKENNDPEFKPAPPQRTASQGYSGIEAYRDPPKRGLSLKDRTRNFFDRLDGRRGDDGSDGYSYSSEESWSSAGLGEVNDQSGQSQKRTQAPPQQQQGGQTQPPQQRDQPSQRQYDDDQYSDDFEDDDQRPGMTRGLSQKIRLNMMRLGSRGGNSGGATGGGSSTGGGGFFSGGRTRSSGKDRQRAPERNQDRDQAGNMY